MAALTSSPRRKPSWFSLLSMVEDLCIVYMSYEMACMYVASLVSCRCVIMWCCHLHVFKDLKSRSPNYPTCSPRWSQIGSCIALRAWRTTKHFDIFVFASVPWPPLHPPTTHTQTQTQYRLQIYWVLNTPGWYQIHVGVLFGADVYWVCKIVCVCVR